MRYINRKSRTDGVGPRDIWASTDFCLGNKDIELAAKSR